MNRIDSRELSEWMAFERLTPFGDEAHNFNFGLLISTIKNMFRGKGSSPVKPHEVALGEFDDGGSQVESSTTGMLGILKSMVSRRKKKEKDG